MTSDALAQRVKISSLNYSMFCDSAGIVVEAHVIWDIAYQLPDGLVTDFGDGSNADTMGHIGIVGNYPYHPIRHRYAAPGRYLITHNLFYNNWYYTWNKYDSSVQRVTVSCHPPAGGELFHDANTNCIFDSSDTRINLSAKIQVDSAGVPLDTISAMGSWQYHILSDSPTVYTFKLLNGPIGYTPTCPSSGTIIYNFHPDSLATLDQHFGFQCGVTPANDYSLSVFRQLRAATSGGASYIGLYASNNSCHRDSGVITLHISPKYSFSGSAIRPAPSSVSGQTITWNHANMADGAISQYYVPLTPASTTVNGDTACTYAIITPIIGDFNAANNTIAICDSVRSSWDPNEKTVLPNGAVSEGTLLTYTIDFENKGNDTAFHIHVQDTLSEHLDPNTFQLLSSTHLVTPYLYENAGGQRVIKFDFQGINLAGKDDSIHNKGQVRFIIKMKDDLPDGTVVANRAGIYFDGNEVVLTNAAFNNIPLPASVQLMNRSSGITVYPNPADEAFMIRVQDGTWTEASLMNSIGQVVSKMQLTAGDNVLHVAQLPAGIYYLQARGSAGIYTVKLEKR